VSSAKKNPAKKKIPAKKKPTARARQPSASAAVHPPARRTFADKVGDAETRTGAWYLVSSTR
jgi:hypothetical protein